MNDTQRAAERITGALSDPAWHPRRHHIEGARNALVEAANEIEVVRHDLRVMMDEYAAISRLVGRKGTEAEPLSAQVAALLNPHQGTAE